MSTQSEIKTFAVGRTQSGLVFMTFRVLLSKRQSNIWEKHFSLFSETPNPDRIAALSKLLLETVETWVDTFSSETEDVRNEARSETKGD